MASAIPLMVWRVAQFPRRQWVHCAKAVLPPDLRAGRGGEVSWRAVWSRRTGRNLMARRGALLCRVPRPGGGGSRPDGRSPSREHAGSSWTSHSRSACGAPCSVKNAYDEHSRASSEVRVWSKKRCVCLRFWNLNWSRHRDQAHDFRQLRDAASGVADSLWLIN